jgi:hypothetical protein
MPNDKRDYVRIKSDYLAETLILHPKECAVEDTYEYEAHLYDILSLPFDIEARGNFWQAVKDDLNFYIRENTIPDFMTYNEDRYTWEGVKK